MFGICYQGWKPEWPVGRFPELLRLYGMCTADRPEDRPTFTEVRAQARTHTLTTHVHQCAHAMCVHVTEMLHTVPVHMVPVQYGPCLAMPRADIKRLFRT